jgi:predicted transcriptional regulator YheO
VSEDVKRLVDICKSFVRSMYRTEEAVSKMDEVLSAEEMKEALKQVLAWIQDTEEIPENSFTREIAREIIGQLSGIIILKDYEGSADYYIA